MVDMTDSVDIARVELVSEMSSAILTTIGNELQKHGPDPQSYNIVAAALAMAITKIELVDPSMGLLITAILQSKESFHE